GVGVGNGQPVAGGGVPVQRAAWREGLAHDGVGPVERALGLGGLGGGGIQRIQLGHELDLLVKPLRRRQTLHDLVPAGHWSPPDTCRARRAIWLLLSLLVTYLLAHM